MDGCRYPGHDLQVFLKSMTRFRLQVFLLCIVLLHAAVSHAQIRTVPKELLDSIANPAEDVSGSFMKFETKRIVTGIIEEDGIPPVYGFRFVNVSDKPLEIRNITSSCGCIVAECSAAAVNPGDSAVVSVTYYPKGHPGRFERRIFVYTGTSGTRPAAVLYLDATVRQGNDRNYLYPHRLGRIRMKVREFTFRSDIRDVVCLDFLNTGDTPVTPRVAKAMLPDFIGAWCETPDVAPGEKGEICISFDPDRYAASQAGRPAGAAVTRVPLILEGLGASPRESSITLNID